MSLPIVKKILAKNQPCYAMYTFHAKVHDYTTNKPNRLTCSFHKQNCYQALGNKESLKPKIFPLIFIRITAEINIAILQL